MIDDGETKFKKGTTTIGLMCSDGVILASESRATMGHLISDKKTKKVLKIQDHIGLTIAGLVGDAQYLGRIMKAQCTLYEVERNRRIDVEGAATLLANILQANKYFPYWVGLIMGGYDKQPKLYGLDAAGGLIKTDDYTSTGSGSPIAYGVLEDQYREDKPVNTNLGIAARAIKAAMERDAYSGNHITIATVTKDGFKYLPQKQIDELLK